MIGIMIVVLGFPSGGQAAEPLVRLWGSAQEEYLQGPLVSGDLDGDGQMDLAVANYRGFAFDYAAGEVFLLPGEALSGELDLVEVPDVIYGVAEHDYLGRSLAILPGSAGDADTLLVGQTIAGLTEREPGVVLWFEGPLLDGVRRQADETKTRLIGDTLSDWLGEQVVVAGDLDGDGQEDVVVGAPTREDEASSPAGAVWIFHDDLRERESAGSVAEVSTAVVEGTPTHRLVGWRVSGPGDLNGDGYDDVVVGALDTTDFSGWLGVFSGIRREAALSFEDASGLWVLETPESYPGFGLDGGDMDGDGQPEVAVSSHTIEEGSGRVWLLDTAPVGTEDLQEAARSSLLGEPSSGTGYTVAVGPVLLVGAPFASTVLALDRDLTLVDRATGEDALGHWVGWLEDLDGDGVEEAAAVAAEATGTHPRQGVAIVASGASISGGDLSAMARVSPDLDGDGVPSAEDCDDGDPRRSPELDERCGDAVDNNCDGRVDEASCDRAGCSVLSQASRDGIWLAVVWVAMLYRRPQRRHSR